MSSATLTYPVSGPRAYDLPLKDWLLYAFAAVYPLLMFSITFSRDSLPFWVVIGLTLVTLLEFLQTRRFWFERSFVYLFLFASAYFLLGTYNIISADSSIGLMGRTPADRAFTIDLRVLYVVLAFVVFTNSLAGASEVVFRRIFKIQVGVGAALALFGILQFVTFVFFNSQAIIDIQPTNETYGGRSYFIQRLGRDKIFRASGLFTEPSWFGFFLVPLTVKFVVGWAHGIVMGPKPVQIVLLVIYCLAIFVNFSLTAILAVAVLMIFFVLRFIWRAPGRALAVLFAGAVVAVAVILSPVGEPLMGRIGKVFALKDVSTLDRLLRAYTGFQVWVENPWLGVGPGGFALLYPRMGGWWSGNIMATPLNIWFSILADVGLAGFIPFLLFLGRILRGAVRRAKEHPLAAVYLWSVSAHLVLLTTIDIWYTEILWFELALLLCLTSGPGLRRVSQPAATAHA